MKYLLTFAAAALIAICVVGLASAQAPPAAPTGVTVLSSGEGFVISWNPNDAAAHRIAWMNRGEYESARDDADGDWTTALHYADVPSGNTYTVPAESLIEGDDYWIIVGSVDRQTPAVVSWGRWSLVTASHGMNADDALTRAYVQAAIAYYDANGRAATVARYRSEASTADGRSLIFLDADAGVLLVYRSLPTLQNQYVGPGSKFTNFQALMASATATGYWSTARGVNPVTKQEEPRRIFAVLHDGLVFAASHSVLTEDVAASTKEYVNRAIARYEKDGLDATIDYYNSQDSLEGQFYLFLIGADDNYLVHPIFPHLINTDIKDLPNQDLDGNPLGVEIAQATEAGIWVEYLWPHPISRKELPKFAWVVRHEGLIFASGYYTGGSETEPPPWRNVADPEQYTVDYVNRAIERYERDGLESMLNYYNSVASFEGEWYLFATDANDVYHVHPLIPELTGTDIKDVVGSDGYELGRALAAAPDGGEGVWVEYRWPHPVTLEEVPKRGYAVRRHGMLFASGYYPPQVADPAARTKEYVQQAIDYYQANGLDATVAHYNSDESVDGQWSLTLADENDVVRVAILSPSLIGTDLKDFGAGRIRQLGQEMVAATEAGLWVSSVFPNTRSSEILYAHTWAIRYDGLLFMSRYYDDRPDVPAAAKTDDQLTREYVEQAIAYYEANGRQATGEYYNREESVAGERYLVLLDDADGAILAVIIFQEFLGEKFSYTEHFREIATDEGVWTEHQGFHIAQTNGDAVVERGPMRSYVVRHDGLIFVSGHSVLSENVAKATQDYVNRAIAHYQKNGLAATIDHYNSQLSLEGHFYLFLIGADDNYLAHPIFPHLIGTDIKDVRGSDGQELGKEIAQATAAGIWVEYLWPHPVSRIDQQKVTWAIRHDGLIFASGYYAGGAERRTPPWQNVDDLEEYTEQYVARAIERYERDGLDAMLNYYNSVASFEGQWYLFATDADDIYHVHPLLPHLIGTDIKNVVGDDGFELGRALAAAQDGGEGVWVDYLWPHPVTLKEVPKRGYAVRRDGMLFASGYYPKPADPDSEVQAYVQKATDYYDANGPDATVAYYGSPASIDGEYVLLILDDQGVIQVFALLPELVGWDVSTFKGPLAGEPIGEWLTSTTAEGHWFEYLYPNARASEVFIARQWAIRHNGYIFSAAHFVEQAQPGPGE